MKTNKFVSIIKSFKDYFVSEPMISLENSFEFSALIRSHGRRFISLCWPQKLGKYFHRLKILSIFFLYLRALTKRHGSVFTVKYLKNSTLAIQKCINGTPLSSLKVIDNLPFPRLANGLPRFIPLVDRKAIRRGNVPVIRYWLSLYSIYRIISIPGKLKIGTITDILSVPSINIETGSKDLRAICSKVKDRFSLSILEKEYWILPIEKASPNSKSSWSEFNIIPSMMKKHHPIMYDLLLRYMDESKLDNLKRLFVLSSLKWGETDKCHIGRLAIKKEPAGKVRVFAMVDIWTQSILNPLHKFLFAFLKGLPNDGTFDQQASVIRCSEKVKLYGKSWGYDLSAATDRLPLALQVSILAELIGDSRAALWGDILTSRQYFFPKNEYTDQDMDLRYAVGQPMGALSSWAMLAVTHHFIVQLAYQRAYLSSKKVNWFDNYELLGDDIVIFDELVAKEYLLLMESYGLEINLSKSVLSVNGGFEFAKNTYYKGENVSAIPFRMLLSNNTRLGRVATVLHFMKTLKVRHPIRYMMRGLMVKQSLKCDWNFNLVATLTMFLKGGSISYTELLKAMISTVPHPAGPSLKAYLPNISSTYISNLIVAFLRGKAITFRDEDKVNYIFGLDSYFHRETLIDRLLDYKDNHDLSFDTFQEELTTQTLRWILKDDNFDFFLLQNKLQETNDLTSHLSFEIFNHISHWFKGASSFVLKIRGDLLNKMTLDELVHLNEELDSFVTLSKLVERSKSKIEGDVSTNLKVCDYNLKALSFIIKNNPKRPLFTYSLDQVQEEFERIQFWWKF